jgi:hypothetical protein
MRSVLVSIVVLLAACGSKHTDNPTGARCTKGEYFLPGCTDEPGIVAGCYEHCATGASACGAGLTCASVTVMPECALANSDVQCDACGEDVMLCVPGATD